MPPEKSRAQQLIDRWERKELDVAEVLATGIVATLLWACDSLTEMCCRKKSNT